MDREAVHDLFDLSGGVALVTGGTRGIGEACAETEAALVARGAKRSGSPRTWGISTRWSSSSSGRSTASVVSPSW